jgi:hypothetical protein
VKWPVAGLTLKTWAAPTVTGNGVSVPMYSDPAWLVRAVGPRQSVLPGKNLEKSVTRVTCPRAPILSSSWWLGSTA